MESRSSHQSNLIKKETLVQVFSCQFYEIFKNTFYENSSGGCFWESKQFRKIKAFFDAQCSQITTALLFWLDYALKYLLHIFQMKILYHKAELGRQHNPKIILYPKFLI